MKAVWKCISVIVVYMKKRGKMNTSELKQIGEYIKKRYDECGLDYKTFNCELIDDKVSYDENFKKIEMILPKTKEMIKAEKEKQEQEIQARLDKEIENITKDSKELERLYYHPIQYIEMVANKKAKGLLLYGETSLGKSYRVKEVLKRLGKKDYLFVSGHITPMRFYSKMYQAKDELVIFDDVDILGNKIILNMIKAGLNENSGNVVEYHTTKKMEIPSSFMFNGQMIILLNDIPKSNEHLKAIESRVLTYNLSFTREEKIKIIFEIAHKSNIEGTTLAERIEIAKWIKDNTNRATQNFNIRLYLQAIEFFKWNKGNWKELASRQIKNDEYTQMIVWGYSEKEFTEKTGLHRATYYRLKQNLNATMRLNATTNATPLTATTRI